MRVIPHPPDTPPPTQAEVEARLHQEGYDCFCWYDVPGTIYPAHAHAHDECIWVLKGEISFDFNGQILVLRPGDRMYLTQGAHHTAKVPQTGGVTYIVGLKRH